MTSSFSLATVSIFVTCYRGLLVLSLVVEVSRAEIPKMALIGAYC